MCSLVIVSSHVIILNGKGLIKVLVSFNLLTCELYSHSAWFLDGRTLLIIFVGNGELLLKSDCIHMPSP